MELQKFIKKTMEEIKNTPYTTDGSIEFDLCIHKKNDNINVVDIDQDYHGLVNNSCFSRVKFKFFS